MSCPNVSVHQMPVDVPSPNTDAEPVRSDTPPPPIDPKVFNEEMKCIAERRKCANSQHRSGTTTSPESKLEDARVDGDLVGLALSGGGIRSASFNLGLLQAFYRAGLLRHIDYLSTVSGGSYMGGWLSTQIRRLGEGKIVGPENLPLTDPPGAKENSAITRLIQAGHYLSHPLLLANRYCFGLLKTNLILASLVLLGGVMVAFAWRLLDQPPFCETILVLTGGVLIEALRPFMVAVILFLSWLMAWTIAVPKRDKLPLWLGMIILGVFAALTFGLPLLEWFFEDLFLHPESLVWRIVRPLPLLFMIAWLLAWAVMAPAGGRTASGGERVPPAERSTNFTRAELVRRFAQLGRPWKRYLAGLAGIAGFWLCWCLAEAYLLELPYAVEVFVRVLLLPPSVLYVAIGGLRWLMSYGPPPTTRTLHTTGNLRWLLLAAGVAFLIGSAIWLATPNINFVPTTSRVVLAPDAGSIQEHRSWLAPLLGALLTSLLPFLRPQRLVESGLRPKHFWEPWLFRIACTAAVLGLPLVVIHFFGRHNASGFNSLRSPELIAEDIDGLGFWERIAKERLLHPGGPSAVLWNKLHENPVNQRGFEQVFRHADLVKIFREQPVPLSPQARAREQELVNALNEIAFSPENTKSFATEVFGIDIVKDTTEAKEQWPNWPKLKPLLDEVKKEPASDYSKHIQAQNYRKINRLLLEAQYPLEIADQETVRRQVVVRADQWFRVVCVAILAVIAFVTVSHIRLNITSLHWYYRDRLAAVYLGGKPAEAPSSGEDLLSHVDTISKGGPYLLINATLNVPSFRNLAFRSLGASNTGQGGCRRLPRRTTTPSRPQGGATTCEPELHLKNDPEQAPSGCTDAFLFSQKWCGSDYTSYQPTDEYEKRVELDLRDAIALSGAAVSLTQVNNPLVLLLMAILNLRLGQWLPNPGQTGPAAPPTAWDLWRDRGGADDQRYFFISDGGHHDNLGLGSLLRRRCRLIIVSDATFDPHYTFADFRRVERRERREMGIRLVPVGGPNEEDRALSFDPIRPVVRCPSYMGLDDEPKVERRLNRHHYLMARIQYPEPGEPDHGYLIYVKPCLTGDEPEELKGHWTEHAEFPHDPTSNQFYDENMIESYRLLGQHIGTELCRDLFHEVHVNLWPEKLSAVLGFVERFAEGKSPIQPPKKAKAKEPIANSPELPRDEEKVISAQHDAQELNGPHAERAAGSVN